MQNPKFAVFASVGRCGDDPTHERYLQGEATILVYGNAGQGWEYSKTNYMRNAFKVTDRHYAKYKTDVGKKMAAAKPRAEVKP